MATAKRRDRERKARKKAILQGASKIFSEKGFFCTTMQDIAGETGLSVGTLYLYYKSKEELYLSLLFEAMEVFTTKLQYLANSSMSPRKKVKSVWDFFSEFKKKHPLYFKAFLWLNDQNFIKGISETVVDQIIEKSKENFGLAAVMIQECIDRKLYREKNPREIVDILWSTFLGLVSLVETRKNLGIESDDNLFDKAFEVIEEGLILREEKEIK